MMSPLRLAVISICCFSGLERAVAQPVIVIDYRYDTNGFFASADRRTALETAATRLTNRLSDTLTAITPTAGNTWGAVFQHPGTGTITTASNLTVAQNQIIVYAGGRPLLGSGVYGLGATGGVTASGSQTFIDTVNARGQSGALLADPTDFGPWGGSVTFNTSVTNWNFSLSPPSTGQVDFLSAAEHQLAHVLGFGTADSWFTYVNGDKFTGLKTAALYGANPFLDSATEHWRADTTYLGSPPLMTPSFDAGVRIELTELDFAGLGDVGWQVTPVPEPACMIGVAAVLLAAGRLYRKRKRGPNSP